MPRRAPTPAHTAPAVPLPHDVRLMNAVASTVFALAAAGAVVAAVLWLMRSPLFPIRAIELDGDLARNSVPTIRANASPKLAGNFFSADLQAGRAAFEAVPWVRHAVVRRIWPDRLAVQLEEHRAVALWEGSSGIGADERRSTDKLVNSFGEVFEANVGDVEDDKLPTLAGPDGSAAQMLALYRLLQPAFARLGNGRESGREGARDGSGNASGTGIERLQLSRRGSWRVELESGAAIELGRGSDDTLLARSERFARTFRDATAAWRQPLEYADLRHADGYAVRLRGVTTVAAAAPPGRRRN